MKRRDLLKHLADHGCVLIREGGNHSWWGHLASNRRSSVLHHNEIDAQLAKKIVKDLGIAELRSS